MTVVVASVKKKWCQLILSGKKTIELRKNFPETIFKETGGEPFTILLYETRANDGAGKIVGRVSCTGYEPCTHAMIYDYDRSLPYALQEACYAKTDSFLQRSCLTRDEIKTYSCGFRFHGIDYEPLFGWLLTGPHALDMTLQEVGIKIAPQSWCYTEVDMPFAENH